MLNGEICLLNDSFPPLIDGVVNVVVNYAEKLTASGQSVSVVTPECPGADDSGWKFPVFRYPSIDLRKQLGYTAGIPFDPETVNELVRREPILLHSHCPIASTILARELRGRLDVPIVLTYHTKYDIDIRKQVHGQFFQEGAIRALVDNVSACDELWVVSHGAGENIRSLGYEGDYVVMPNGVDIPRQRASDADVERAVSGYDLPSGIPVFLFVGRLMWYKGIRIILDALAALKSRAVPFRMVFVGGGGDEKEIKAYVEKLKLGDQCFFTGPVSDRKLLTGWYTRADLFLFPSTFDTNGLVVREAAGCGLGTVMVSGSCAAEGVTDNRNGVLIEENAASLAVALAELSHYPETMHQIGVRASDELYLSWDEAVKCAEERYPVVVENYRSRHKLLHRFSEEFMEFQDNLLEMFH